MVHRNIRPNDEILLNEIFSVEEVVEVNERVSRI